MRLAPASPAQPKQVSSEHSFHEILAGISGDTQPKLRSIRGGEALFTGSSLVLHNRDYAHKYLIKVRVPLDDPLFHSTGGDDVFYLTASVLRANEERVEILYEGKRYW